MAGRTGQATRGSFNGLDCKDPLPATRATQWIDAFRRVNADSLQALHSSVQRKLQTLAAEELGANGTELAAVAADPEHWWGNLGMIQFQKLRPEHAEDAHFDGGASASILTITLWGARSLALFSEDGSEEFEIFNEPGSVYCACLCPVEHQVRYPASLTSELVEADIAHLPGLGEAGVSIIFRTSLFGQARGSTPGSLPGPIPVYKVWQEAFNAWAKERRLQLPTLREVRPSEGSQP